MKVNDDKGHLFVFQARRQLNWNGGGMDSQYKLLSELLSDQAAFITSPKKQVWQIIGGALPPCPPAPLSVYGPVFGKRDEEATVNISGPLIKESDEEKLLGVALDSKLNCKVTLITLVKLRESKTTCI